MGRASAPLWWWAPSSGMAFRSNRHRGIHPGDSELSPRYDDCFATERALQEFYAIDADGNIIFDNLIDRPDHEAVQAVLSDRLQAWRTTTMDTDYEPHSR